MQLFSRFDAYSHIPLDPASFMPSCSGNKLALFAQDVQLDTAPGWAERLITDPRAQVAAGSVALLGILTVFYRRSGHHYERLNDKYHGWLTENTTLTRGWVNVVDHLWQESNNPKGFKPGAKLGEYPFVAFWRGTPLVVRSSTPSELEQTFLETVDEATTYIDAPFHVKSLSQLHAILADQGCLCDADGDPRLWAIGPLDLSSSGFHPTGYFYKCFDDEKERYMVIRPFMLATGETRLVYTIERRPPVNNGIPVIDCGEARLAQAAAFEQVPYYLADRSTVRDI